MISKRTLRLTAIGALGLGLSTAALGLPWDLDMADSQAIKGYEQEMRGLPEGVVAQDNVLTPVGFSHNMDRMKVMAKPDLLTNPVEGTPEVLAQGARMFNIYCSPCHGDGQTLGPVAAPGRFPGVIPLAGVVAGRPDGYLYLTIRNGGAIMPYYGWAMNDAEMWSIVHHLRTLPNSAYKPR